MKNIAFLWVKIQIWIYFYMLICQFFYPGSSLVTILKPLLSVSPFMLGCPPLWHLGKLRGTSYLPRGHFSNMLVSAMQRLFFDVKLATPTQIRSLRCKRLSKFTFHSGILNTPTRLNHLIG